MTERGMERERHTMKRKCIFFTLVELIIVIVCTCILFLAWTLYEEYVLHPKELDRELVCACYLQQIYKACHQYSLSNDGRFPCARSVPDPKTSEWASKTDCCEDFELLRTQYLDDSKMFLCPDNEFGERAQKGVSLSNTGPKFNVTYAWYRGVSTRDDPLTTALFPKNWTT